MIEAFCASNGSAFCTVNTIVVVSLGDLTQRQHGTAASVGEQRVQSTMVLIDAGVQRIELFELRGVDGNTGGFESHHCRYEMPRIPDFEGLAMFAKVAEEGSYAAAARAMGVSVPTVSRAVARLEERPGGRLFNRTSRQL